MKSAWSVLVSFGLLWLLLERHQVASRQCLQCTTIADDNCRTGIDVLSTNCSGRYQDALYCIKYVGYAETDPIIFRSCEIIEKASGCRYKRMEKQWVKICLSVCDTDGCNRGASGQLSTTLLVVTLLLTCFELNKMNILSCYNL